MDIGRQNVEDPMHQMANCSKAMFMLALNIKAGELTLKKRTAEIRLGRFPELEIFTVQEENKKG